MGKATNVAAVSVVVLSAWIGHLVNSKEDVMYRAGQAFNAVVALHRLPETRIQNFLNAYEMFEMDAFTGTPDQMQFVKDYYETLNHLCAMGNYEKMYLPPLIDPGLDTYSNQKIFEKRMASTLDVDAGSRVLDIGCGRGRIAHLVASQTGAHVTGINIDQDQLRSAEAYANQTGMQHKLDFVEANYNERLPFEDGHFDAVYYVQVIGGYGTNLTKLFTEINRVLKPGGKAMFEDYVSLPGYDASNPAQKKLVQASKAVLGVVHYYTDDDYTSALRDSGLETIHRRNASVVEQARLLERDRDFFLPLTRLVTFLNSLGLVPPHFAELLLRMTKGTDDCIEAHRQMLVTGDIETLVQKRVQ